MKYMKEKTLRSSITRICNGMFKYYSSVPCTSTVMNYVKLIDCVNIGRDGEVESLEVYDNYVDLIKEYIHKNFSEYKI